MASLLHPLLLSRHYAGVFSVSSLSAAAPKLSIHQGLQG